MMPASQLLVRKTKMKKIKPRGTNSGIVPRYMSQSKYELYASIVPQRGKKYLTSKHSVVEQAKYNQRYIGVEFRNSSNPNTGTFRKNPRHVVANENSSSPRIGARGNAKPYRIWY